MKLILHYVRSVKHSHVYKAEGGDNSNAYISKKALGENPPPTVLISTKVEETPTDE